MNSGWNRSGDTLSMQEEAVRRVRDMQDIARRKVEESNQLVTCRRPEHEPKTKSGAPPVFFTGKAPNPFGDLLGKFTKNKDQLLILLLLIVLLNEDCDETLLLALLYILL